MAESTIRPVLSIYSTVGSKVSDLAINNGQLIFVRDKKKIALDFDGKRTFYNQIEELVTDSARKSMLAPVTGSYYFVIETGVLWTFQNGWVQITTPPQEIVHIGANLPEAGSDKTLYVDTANCKISVWSNVSGNYITVADKTVEITADDVNTMFNTN